MTLGALRDLVAATVFVTFVAWGLYSGRRRRAHERYVLFVIGVSFAVGISQRVSLFPFVGWTLLGVAPKEYAMYRILGVDAQGNEHPIDYRAWQPISWWELPMWINQEFDRLGEHEQRSAVAYLLHRAETARQRAQRGERPGTYHRPLGSFAAPLFVTFRPIWDGPGAVPSETFLGLRIYLDSWNVAARAVDSSAVTRGLVYEYLP